MNDIQFQMIKNRKNRSKNYWSKDFWQDILSNKVSERATMSHKSNSSKETKQSYKPS